MVRWLDLHFSGWPVALVSAGGKIDKTADAEPYLGKLGVRAWSGWAVCGPGKRRRCWCPVPGILRHCHRARGIGRSAAIMLRHPASPAHAITPGPVSCRRSRGIASASWASGGSLPVH